MPCLFFVARENFLLRHAVIFSLPCVWRGVKIFTILGVYIGPRPPYTNKSLRYPVFDGLNHRVCHPKNPFGLPHIALWDTPNSQMGVFYNTSCCHSYGCFTPLKRVCLPSYSEGKGKNECLSPVFGVETAYKTHFLMQKP